MSEPFDHEQLPPEGAPAVAPGAVTPPPPYEPPLRTSRRRGRRAGGPRPRPALLLLSLVLVTVLGAGVLVGGGYLISRALGGGSADYAGPGSGEVIVQVAQGDSAAAIGRTLVSTDVVKSVQAFTDAAGAESRSASIQPGFYRLKKQMKASGAVGLLLDPAARVRTRVVVPEGFSLEQTLQRVASSTEIPLADLRAAVAAPATLGLPDFAGTRVEGYLFPATYEIGPGTTATQALQMMTSRFTQAAADVDLVTRARAVGRTPAEIVVIASMLEREGKTAEEFGKISRVVYNRLAKGTALGLESTVRYALGGADGTRLLQSQLDKAKASPYDTFTHVGLPPGPIGNPGQAALEAALAPTPGPWTYFVTLPKSDRSVFTESAAEFARLVVQCQAEGGC